MNTEPLIWTIRGNLPLASLRYEHKWDDGPDEVTFSECWFAEDGELVKNNCHKLAKKQLSISGEQVAMA